MRTELFDYELPDELIARRPPETRDGGRLLLVDRDRLEDRRITELPALIEPGSLVVVNDSRVMRARLLGNKRGSGGRTEILLLRRLEREAGAERWQALGRASKALKQGSVVEIGALLVKVLERAADGTLMVELRSEGMDVDAALELHGRVPIPPYMARDDDAEDAVRYQTVYAERSGSVAAPTAGLHLTPELLRALAERGVELARLTLHIGLGTFRPVTTEELDEHPIHEESIEVSDALALSIGQARRRGAKVVAVGTTVVRALESAADPERPGHVRPLSDATRLFIRPGFRFSVVDALLTNFHLPRSTLLALVAAFAGRERVLAAYRKAVSSRYRFLSYGDAMWIPARLSAEAAP